MYNQPYTQQQLYGYPQQGYPQQTPVTQQQQQAYTDALMANYNSALQIAQNVISQWCYQGRITEPIRAQLTQHLNSINPSTRNPYFMDMIVSTVGAGVIPPNVLSSYVERYLSDLIQQFTRTPYGTTSSYAPYGYPQYPMQQPYGQQYASPPPFTPLANVNSGYSRSSTSQPVGYTATPTPSNGSNQPPKTTTQPTTIVNKNTMPTEDLSLDDTTSIGECRVVDIAAAEDRDLSNKSTAYQECTGMFRYTCEKLDVISHAYMLNYPYNTIRDGITSFKLNNTTEIADGRRYAHILELDTLHLIPGNAEYLAQKWEEITAKLSKERLQLTDIHDVLLDLKTLGEGTDAVIEILVELAKAASYVFLVRESYVQDQKQLITFYPADYAEVIEILTGNLSDAWKSLPGFVQMVSLVAKSSLSRMFTSTRKMYLQPAFDDNHVPNRDACILASHPALGLYRGDKLGAQLLTPSYTEEGGLVGLAKEDVSVITNRLATIFPLKVRHKILYHNLDLKMVPLGDHQFELELTPETKVLEKLVARYPSKLHLVHADGTRYDLGKNITTGTLLLHK